VKNVSRSIRRLLVVLVAVMLAGCSNEYRQAQIPSDSTQITAQPRAAISAHRDLERSWMSPSAKWDSLLYVSDGEADVVYVYTYPKGKLVGKLVGFNEPSGLCSDTKGNVWITNYNGDNIIEYAHGGTKPIATLSDPGTGPNGCSVDPTTGNLAVAGTLKSINGPSQPGAFAIYAKATGPPHVYSVPFAVTSNCGYNESGNLSVDGFGWGEKPMFALVELRKGDTLVKNIAVNEVIGEPGAVQWDAKHLLVGDNEAKAIYEFTIKGGSATEVGALWINFGEGHMGKFRVQGSRLIVPTAIGSGPSIRVYTYPGGAGPIKTITGLENPVGVTISAAPKR